MLSKGAPKTIHLLTAPNRWAGDARRPDSTKTQTEIDGRKTIRDRKSTKEHGTLTDVWRLGVGYGKTTKDDFVFAHPAVMPEQLAERPILTWSDAGDLVLDPFAGTGTTAKMARLHGRRFMGCEISAEYLRIAEKRLALPYTANLFTDAGRLPFCETESLPRPVDQTYTTLPLPL